MVGRLVASGVDLEEPAVAERYATFFSGLRSRDLPEQAKEVAINDLLDMAGLCVAARRTDYVAALLDGWDGEGTCTAIGHARPLDAAGAALVNGTATHGEDFDDTLEGAPIRVGAMVIPAVLAACERYGRSGDDALRGIIAGLETICRVNHVAPGHMHKAGFHPVGVIGVFGATVGVATALRLDAAQLTRALGIAGSLSSGIIEFLTEGSWTKRLHPGWAAHSGYRAALLGRGGFHGPRTVFEGGHGFFTAFAPSAEPDLTYLTEGLGEEWMMERIVFKPYACGTMIHPYIDCMIRLAEDGIRADDIDEIVCPTGEGLVHRLWEPLEDKHAPPSGYAAKFSMPFGMAVGFFERDAGLEQFTDEKARDPEILALARKISYVIDPDNEYPRNYTGHLLVTLTDGTKLEKHQPHMRGGMHEPLTRNELIDKFEGNVSYGGWDTGTGRELLEFCLGIGTAEDLSGLVRFRR
jgi:2-methylcitrate dehydratase PrpD